MVKTPQKGPPTTSTRCWIQIWWFLKRALKWFLVVFTSASTAVCVFLVYSDCVCLKMWLMLNSEYVLKYITAEILIYPACSQAVVRQCCHASCSLMVYMAKLCWLCLLSSLKPHWYTYSMFQLSSCEYSVLTVNVQKSFSGFWRMWAQC